MPFGEQGPLSDSATKKMRTLLGFPIHEVPAQVDSEEEIRSLRARLKALTNEAEAERTPLGSRLSFDEYMQMMAKERATWAKEQR